jgi:dihydroneopterin aldolase
VRLDLSLECDVRPAAKSDQLEDALNYEVLEAQVVGAVKKTRFRLVEALAEHVAEICLKQALVKSVRVMVEKPGALPLTRSVAGGDHAAQTRGRLVFPRGDMPGEGGEGGGVAGEAGEGGEGLRDQTVQAPLRAVQAVDGDRGGFFAGGVGADGLAELLRGGGDVEQVVGDLEGFAEGGAIGAAAASAAGGPPAARTPRRQAQTIKSPVLCCWM